MKSFYKSYFLLLLAPPLTLVVFNLFLETETLLVFVVPDGLIPVCICLPNILKAVSRDLAAVA